MCKKLLNPSRENEIEIAVSMTFQKVIDEVEKVKGDTVNKESFLAWLRISKKVVNEG